VATVLSVGLRPCSGAILVLVLAYAMNLVWAGVAAVMAMSAGTALTVSALASRFAVRRRRRSSRFAAAFSRRWAL
jgi:ABC-type nickel/cobalt efflux system permease component RcnA